MIETALVDTLIDPLGFVQWRVGIGYYPGDPSQLVKRLDWSLNEPIMPPIGNRKMNPILLPLVERWSSSEAPYIELYEQWRVNHFGNWATSDGDSGPEADPDGDGLSNEAEWLLGEDPQNPETTWHIQLKTTAVGALMLQFPRKAGVGFEAQSTSDLRSPNWQPVDCPENRPWFSAQDEVASIPLSANRTSSAFFRVRIYPQ